MIVDLVFTISRRILYQELVIADDNISTPLLNYICFTPRSHRVYPSKDNDYS
uniref:Uncharacterized protein n=1 Tax=Rhizophora mucronata TaxID=61149 RepID=A0A2P2N9C1_RHIMU